MYSMTKENTVLADIEEDGQMFKIRHYIGRGGEVGNGGPQAYMLSVPVGVTVRPHFHRTDQFQLFFGTRSATFGKAIIPPVYVHYVDGYTPYGPFGPGEAGLDYFTLRATPSFESFHVPEERHKLVGKPGRHFAVEVTLAPWGGEPRCRALIPPHADGLAAYHLSAGPGQTATAPVTPASGGQYIVVVRGAMACRDGRFPFQACMFAGPDEEPLRMQAGPEQGFDAVVMQFRPQKQDAPSH